MYEDLEAQFTDLSQYVPFRHRLGYIYWQKGEKERATDLLEEQMKLDLETQQGIRGYGAWSNGSYYYDLAAVNSFLGNREEALAWLDSATTIGFSGFRIIHEDPLFDNIRDTRDFRMLIRAEQEKNKKIINAFKEILKEKNEMVPSVS
jgi:tetratricopeptide (TPR) repeat protein